MAQCAGHEVKTEHAKKNCLDVPSSGEIKNLKRALFLRTASYIQDGSRKNYPEFCCRIES